MKEMNVTCFLVNTHPKEVTKFVWTVQSGCGTLIECTTHLSPRFSKILLPRSPSVKTKGCEKNYSAMLYFNKIDGLYGLRLLTFSTWILEISPLCTQEVKQPPVAGHFERITNLVSFSVTQLFPGTVSVSHFFPLTAHQPTDTNHIHVIGGEIQEDRLQDLHKNRQTTSNSFHSRDGVSNTGWTLY